MYHPHIIQAYALYIYVCTHAYFPVCLYIHICIYIYICIPFCFPIDSCCMFPLVKQSRQGWAVQVPQGVLAEEIVYLVNQ